MQGNTHATAIYAAHDWTHRGLLEVVQHAFLEDEPAPVLRLVLASLLGEPALALGVEEGFGQVALAVWYLELFLLDTLKQLLIGGGGGGIVRVALIVLNSSNCQS